MVKVTLNLFTVYSQKLYIPSYKSVLMKGFSFTVAILPL